MPWAMVAVAAYAANYGKAQEGKFLVYGVGTPPRDEIAEAASAHRAKMAEMHAETMRGAKVGTYLLCALLVSAIACVAQLAGLV